MPRVSAKSVRRDELRAEKDRAKNGKGWRTQDSFQNFMAKIGVGTDNLASAGTYGFNPITRERQLLEWIHRGSWIGGLAIDVIADDMTRAGVEIEGTISPEQIDEVEAGAQLLDLWGGIRDTVAWGRLYGGAIGVIMLDGQDYSTPLRVDRVGKGQFRGVLALDRWMVQPSLEDLVTEPGPHIGLPKYYTVMSNAPGLRMEKIHHSRCMRMGGYKLPYYQSVVENLWDESILERLYDRLIAFDSTTQGVAQLVYKSYLRTYAIKNLRELIATGGDAVNGLVQYVMTMARFQSIEGITLIDAEDKFEAHEHSSFSGLGEVLIHLGQQVSGALQIPLVRLFGQSPVGLNSSGESDLRTYYDGISSAQQKHLKVGVTDCYKMLMMSIGIRPSPDFAIKFRPLWLMSETDRATIAQTVTGAISAGVDMGVPQSVALKELRQSSDVTGVWSNISDEDIASSNEMTMPPTEIQVAEVRGESQVTAAEEKAKAEENKPLPEGFKPNGAEPKSPPVEEESGSRNQNV